MTQFKSTWKKIYLNVFKCFFFNLQTLNIEIIDYYYRQTIILNIRDYNITLIITTL